MQVAVRRELEHETGSDPGPNLLLPAIPGYRPGAFLLSVGLHAVIIYVVVAFVHFEVQAEQAEMRRPHERLIYFKVPDEASVEQSRKIKPPPVERKPAPAPAKTEVARRLPAPDLPKAEPERPAQAETKPAAPAKRFDPPPVTPRKADPVPQILLQPDVENTVAKNAVVPSMVILNRVLNRKQFVRPADVPKNRAIPAQPILDVPVPMLGDTPALVTSNKVPLDRAPVLPAPRGMPASVSGDARPDKVPEAVATVSGSGNDPVNIISLPARAVPLADTISVPSVQMTGSGSAESVGGHGQLAGDGSAGTANDGRTSPTPAVAGTGTAGAGALRAGTAVVGGAGPAGSGVGAGGGNSMSPGHGGVGGSGAGDGGGNGSGGTGTGREAGLVRIMRVPSAKDVVITQTNSFIPGTAALLAGRPVYTVYVSVGEGRDWILQYCLPPSPRPAQRNGTVVALGSMAAVNAPFATMILRPAVHFKAGVRYAFLHGTINTSGHLENVTVAGQPALDDADGVLGAIRQWGFQPASRDGVPVAVEVLICIPNAAS